MHRSMHTSRTGLKVFLAPDSLPTSFYEENFKMAQIHRMSDKYFESVASYNYLMMQPSIYNRFADYRFMLVVQTDAVLLKAVDLDSLTDFDFIGAPWPSSLYYLSIGPRLIVSDGSDPSKNRVRGALIRFFGQSTTVGNGGLSVRKTSSFASVTHLLIHQSAHLHEKGINEDVVFSTRGRQLGLRIAPPELAEELFRERITLAAAEQLGIYGVHAPNDEIE